MTARNCIQGQINSRTDKLTTRNHATIKNHNCTNERRLLKSMTKRNNFKTINPKIFKPMIKVEALNKTVTRIM